VPAQDQGPSRCGRLMPTECTAQPPVVTVIRV
jgi:hypothetical protein